MITQIYPYSRDISASMHVNANKRKFFYIKCLWHLIILLNILKLFQVSFYQLKIFFICVHLRSFAFSFSLLSFLNLKKGLQIHG